MRVIGIDPGSKVCGYGIVEQEGTELQFIESGVICPKALLSIHKRLYLISEGISLKIQQFAPTCMAIEKVFVAKNSKSALHLGQARGALLTIAGGLEMEVHEYSSTTVKKTVTGNGRASKEEMQKIVSMIIGKKTFESSDESDAIAIAVCHINNVKNSAKIPCLPTRKTTRRRRFRLDDFTAERKNF